MELGRLIMSSARRPWGDEADAKLSQEFEG